LISFFLQCYDWWLDEMYMKVQLPLPVNSNPGMVFPKRHFADQNAQLKYAAQLISAILDYKTIVDSRSLPIDRARSNRKGQPLCMEQYYRLFTSYRVPGLNKDNLVTNSTKLMPEPEHIIVICKNQLFVLDVMLNFSRLTDDDLYTQLWRIAKVAEEGEKNAEPVGILTSLRRNKWASARQKLMEDSANRDSLDAIERSIFILSLDKKPPVSFNHQNSVDETREQQRDDVSMAIQMLHGMGSQVNSANRWFDKTMQFVVSEDGVCGLNYEHSPSEGIAVVQLVEHTLKYMEELRAMRLHRMQSICDLPYPRKLKWKLTEVLNKDIADASKAIDKLISDLDLYVLRFTNFGKEFPKSQNMSPDSFIQLALQLTYYKIHGHLVSTYESASTRRFRYGRVDNIRAASPAALEWVKSMTGETNIPDEDKMRLLRTAMKTQTEIMTQTILGQGVDCHLMGLREISNEKELPIPEIFADESYKLANHFTLSTSQVPTTMDAFMCYGPVVPDGYGVCYNPHSDYIVAVVTSFRSHSETRSDYFAFTLESSFLQMYELCYKTKDMDKNTEQKIPEETHATKQQQEQQQQPQEPSQKSELKKTDSQTEKTNSERSGATTEESSGLNKNDAK
ncbi:choline O-acetyltransferase, partial [Octopus bimaculoides]